MKNAFVISKLDSSQILKMVKLSPPRLFNTESEIIYEGHVPTAGYLLIEGEIQFLKNKRLVQTIKEGALFGVNELMNNCPIKYTVRIIRNSKVCILDKSTIRDILDLEEAQELPQVIRDLKCVGSI